MGHGEALIHDGTAHGYNHIVKHIIFDFNKGININYNDETFCKYVVIIHWVRRMRSKYTNKMHEQLHLAYGGKIPHRAKNEYLCFQHIYT